MHNYSREELLALGFTEVGEDTVISRDVRFFAITGKIGNRVRIDTYTIVTGHVVLEDDVHLSPLCFLSGAGGCITMARGSGIGPQVAILTKSDDYTAADLDTGDDSKIAGDISIGAQSILGAGCKVFPGVTIGNNVSIGSHCLINKDVKDGDMLVSRSATVMTLGNRLSDT